MSMDTFAGTANSRFESIRSNVNRLFGGNYLAIFGMLVIGVLILVAIFAPVIAPSSPTSQDYSAVLKGPSPSHLLGTDNLGRDQFSRVVYAYRVIFMITFIGVMAAFAIGVTLGVVAGYLGGATDEVIMRGIDILMAFPSLILGLALIAAIGPSKWGIIIVIGVAYTPLFARVIRGEVTSLKEEEFIQGLLVRGVSTPRIMFRHLLPNAVGPITVSVTLQLAFGILTTATLSFLGVGIQPPQASLGLMLSNGIGYIDQAWWMSFFPGVAIVLPVVGFNTLGDGFRDSFDPTQTRK